MRQEGAYLIGSQSAPRHLLESRRTLRDPIAATGPDYMAGGAPAAGKLCSSRRIGARPPNKIAGPGLL
jgi:hypothetical protein